MSRSFVYNGEMNIGITLTSSMHVGQEYIDLTRRVVEALAKEGHGIVYGGTSYGMMLELATSYKAAGGSHLVGVMAEDLMAATKGYQAFQGLDERHIEPTMGLRKEKIISLSDAVLILPGGYGTLEEFADYIGGKVNKLYDKPLAILNYGGFYDSFITFCREMAEKEFSKIRLEDVVFVSDDLDAILRYFKDYTPVELEDKFVK